MKHIEFTKLVERSEGILPLEEDSAISKHLVDCFECSNISKKVGEFFLFAKAEPFEDVSHNLTAALLNIYQPKNKPQKSAGLVERLIGELVFDDWQTVLNERLLFSDSRQLLYRVKNFEIDLRLQFADGKCLMSGQIFPDLETTANLYLISEKSTVATALIVNGEFKFQPIDEGIYDLIIDFGKTNIEIDQISLLG
jgi:hypothetical protein